MYGSNASTSSEDDIDISSEKVPNTLNKKIGDDERLQIW